MSVRIRWTHTPTSKGLQSNALFSHFVEINLHICRRATVCHFSPCPATHFLVPVSAGLQGLPPWLHNAKWPLSPEIAEDEQGSCPKLPLSCPVLCHSRCCRSLQLTPCSLMVSPGECCATEFSLLRSGVESCKVLPQKRIGVEERQERHQEEGLPVCGYRLQSPSPEKGHREVFETLNPIPCQHTGFPVSSVS